MVQELRSALGSHSPSVTRRVAYSLAAGAAASAVATDADANIVYSGVQNTIIGQGFSLNLNLDGDASADIRLKNYTFSGVHYQAATVDFSPGKVVGFTVGSNHYVSALTAGNTIDSSTVGPTFYGIFANGAGKPNAQFLGTPTTALVGLSFPISSVTHYGWVRVTVDNAAGTFTVNDWAYETLANTGISAGATASVPETSPLGLLAVGSVGLLALRRWRNRQLLGSDGSGSEELATA